MSETDGRRSPRFRPDASGSPLRDDEAFAITSIARAFSGTWRPGENPPDAYLLLGAEIIAVEISTLTQHVTDDKGTRPASLTILLPLRPPTR
jgi:hypothetical protein